MSRSVAEVRDLTVGFGAAPNPVYALRNVSLTLKAGQITGVVGESGSGKSTLALALIGLLPNVARTLGGSIRIGDQELVGQPEKTLRAMRGAKVSMVFQDPMTSLNPARSIGGHLMDAQHRDRSLGRAALIERAIGMLKKVGVPDPASQLARYPHQLSGGMRQRIAIAMALLGRPELLIADEPTTALDVTLEAQILHLLRELKREIDGSIVFISHNLGAVAEICDHVVVCYAGEVLEEGDVRTLFHDPRHPYTKALLDCDPARIEEATRDLPSIPGETPVVRARPTACTFAPRCAKATDLCRAQVPQWHQLGEGRGARCHYAEAVQ
ncbi:MAG: ABC transporter ATP-binding protein [Rhodobacteraceae bacterium]|nr:ABC transporter ATP-binding protein [Paracoccaceae bacterium]